MIKISVDAMGGDNAPEAQVLGSMLAVKEKEDIEVILYGNEQDINKYLKPHPRIKVKHTSAPVISMGEKDPTGAMRKNKENSMALALKSVSAGNSDAVVSSGATQALIVGSHLYIKRLKGIKRTAIAPIFPHINGIPTLILDCGANVEITKEALLQQAYCANIYVKEVMGIAKPKIGLINIGEEPGKGRPFDKEVFEMLENDASLNFIGNIEPSFSLDNDCDILISDGFTANIVLKSVVGTFNSVAKSLKVNLKKGIIGKIGLVLSAKNLKRFKKQLSADDVGGALIFGLRAPVIKAQGSSNSYAFMHGILKARMFVEKDVIKKISAKIEEEN